MSDDRPSDATPDLSKQPADPGTAPAAAPAVRPGAAAARRARQLGGARRPSPTAGPTTGPITSPAAGPAAGSTAAAPGELDTNDTTATTPTTPTTPTTGERTGATAAPRSSVGRAAARPRPRPRPTPADGTDSTDSTDSTGIDGTGTDGTTGTDDTTAADGTTGRPRRTRGLLVGAVLLSVLLLAAGALLLVLTVTAKPAVSQRETDRAVAAAKTDVALVTSYGYQTVDTDAAKAAAALTGDFKNQYLAAIASTVKPQLPTTQTVSTGQVDAAGVVSADRRGRQVVVLVYGQQAVTDKAQTTPRIDAFQVRVTMQKVGDDWLVAKLDQLGNNA